MKPGKYWGKTIPGFKRLRFFLPIFLVIIILSLLFAPLSALGGNPQTEKKKVTKLRDDWVKGDGKHYLGLNPPAPGNNNSKMLAKLPQQNLLNLPTSVDLSSQLPPVGDQGGQGSCVGWATCYYYKSWLEKQEHSSWSLSDPTHQFSPSFTYNQIRDPFGGSFIHMAFYYLANQGDVDLGEMPYNPADDETLPTPAQFEAAKAYRNSADWGCFFNHEAQGPYGTPNNMENLKAWLATGKMLVIGMPVYSDFPDYGGNAASPYYDYNGNSGLAGGHAVCISGYNDSINPSGADADHRGGFKMVNSWGPGWNGTSAGFLYLSYDFVKNYVWDAWAAYDKTPDSPSISSLSATAGNTGDTIHIYGSNFGTLRRNAKVTFNGVAATTVNFTDADITVTVPSGAGGGGAPPGPVTVYNWEGTPSNQLTFTVGATSPSVASASPNYATQGTSVSTTITLSSFGLGPTARLQKETTVINASSVSVISSNQIRCVFNLSGATAGSYDIIVGDLTGSEGRLHNGFTVQPANPNILNCSTPNLDTAMGCSQPSLSADGRYVAFYSTSKLVPGVNYTIYRKDLQTGAIVNCVCDAAGARVPGDVDESAAISADGRYVAFSVDNSPPLANLYQIYLKDLQTGALSCCSTDASGTLGNGKSSSPCISSDARYVAFTSGATNLAPNDTNGTYDIFRKDLQTGAIICCSTDAAGNLGNSNSSFGGSGPSITPDGRYVAFESWASNLVPGDYNWWDDIFRKDCVTGKVLCCSVDAAGNMDFNNHNNPSISSDGRYVAFTAGGFTTLVPGCYNCQVVRKDLQTGEVLACSADVYGNATGNQVEYTAISGDGRYVAFASNANELVPGEVGPLSIYINDGFYSWDVFRKDLVTGEIVCCATDALGNWENAPCSELLGLSISLDGRYVAFVGYASNLVPGLPLGNYVFRKDCGAINVPRISGVSPSYAKAGSEITLTGSGFGSTRGSSKVEFGMIDPTSYTAWSDTQIKCLVPSNVVGDVLLRVVTASSVSNLKAFKITLYPAPTVSSITPNAGDQNTTVSITNLAGTNFVSGATVHLERGTSIINASNVAVVSSNQITCNFNLTNVATGAYDVVVTNPDGPASRLTGGFTVNAPVSPCGAGAGTLSFGFGVVMGLLSLAGSGGLFQRSRRKRKKQ